MGTLFEKNSNQTFVPLPIQSAESRIGMDQTLSHVNKFSIMESPVQAQDLLSIKWSIKGRKGIPCQFETHAILRAFIPLTI